MRNAMLLNTNMMLKIVYFKIVHITANQIAFTMCSKFMLTLNVNIKHICINMLD